jgi:hypothetical protein
MTKPITLDQALANVNAVAAPNSGKHLGRQFAIVGSRANAASTQQLLEDLIDMYIAAPSDKNPVIAVAKQLGALIFSKKPPDTKGASMVLRTYVIIEMNLVPVDQSASTMIHRLLSWHYMQLLFTRSCLDYLRCNLRSYKLQNEAINALKSSEKKANRMSNRDFACLLLCRPMKKGEEEKCKSASVSLTPIVAQMYRPYIDYQINSYKEDRYGQELLLARGRMKSTESGLLQRLFPVCQKLLDNSLTLVSLLNEVTKSGAIPTATEELLQKAVRNFSAALKDQGKSTSFSYAICYKLLRSALQNMPQDQKPSYERQFFSIELDPNKKVPLPTPEEFAQLKPEGDEEVVVDFPVTVYTPRPVTTAAKRRKNKKSEHLFEPNSKVPEPPPAAATTAAAATTTTVPPPKQPAISFDSIVRAAKPPFRKLQYDQRVHEQMTTNGADWRHGFSGIIAKLLGTEYATETVWTNTTTAHPDRLFSIYGKVETAGGKAHHGTFEFAFGKDGACYHRFFREKKLEELLGPDAIQKVYEMEFPTPAEAAKTYAAAEALEKDVASIVVDSEFGFITFRDSTHNLTITLFKR